MGDHYDNEQLQKQNVVNETIRTTAFLEISEKFWTNDIIWQEITSYLSISDLKDLSCVNNYFLHKVRGINRFISLSGQVVTGKLEIHVFQLSRAIVLVNKIDVKALMEKASQIFQDTEYLEIHGLSKLSDTDRNSRLIEIISNCPNLKSLAFGKYNFLIEKFDSFLKHTKVKLILSKLQELHLEVYNKKYYSDKDHEKYITTKIEIGSDPLQSFKLLSDLQMSLEKFSYESSEFLNVVTCFFSPELVLGSSQNTLVELKLHVHFGATLGLQNLKFPKLEKFSLTLNKALSYRKETFNQQTFDTNFVLFLKNHLFSLTRFQLDYPQFDISFTAVCEVLTFCKKIRTLYFGRTYEKTIRVTFYNEKEQYNRNIED